MANLSLKILCPYHKAEENVGFPDSYDWDNFEGEMWCGAPAEKDKAKLLIRLKNRKIQRVVVKEEPGIHISVSGDELAKIYRDSRRQFLETGGQPLGLADGSGEGERPAAGGGDNSVVPTT